MHEEQHATNTSPSASQVPADISPTEVTLATRWRRLLAQLIDTFIIMVPYLVFWYLAFGFEDLTNGMQPSFVQLSVASVFWLACWVAINLKHLRENAQTIGKKTMGIRVAMLDGGQPNLTVLIGQRYMVYLGFGLIPVIGGIVSTINILWIFSGERRCLHDHLAVTKVINV